MKKISTIILATIIVTLVVVFGGNQIIKVTGDAPFCGSCHEWDGFAAQAHFNDDVHGKANPKGVRATCTDCHLPHNSLIEYLAVKAKNGVAEGWTTLTKDRQKKDWLKNREHARKNYTFDSSCLKCHEGILSYDGKTQTASARMHEKYKEFLNTQNAMQCTQCHKFVGHKNLGDEIAEKQGGLAKTWDEWEKLNVKKD